MNKKALRILSFLLCTLLAAGISVPAAAEDAALVITSPEEFAAFAENCLLDRYSRNLSVRLDGDLTLSDEIQIPIFAGTFDGNGHRISGIRLKKTGSSQGLFRYLTETALVENLTLDGSIDPAGSASDVGMLAGNNAGTIRNCHASVEVSGKDRVGGLVGANALTGTLEDCSVTGSIHGNHFVGGIAGQNSGVIRSCENSAQINVTAQHNQVQVSEISISALTGSESAGTVTDVGGITGQNSGVIRDSRNLGNVGYAHMGYNMGGIAGSQSGYITGCVNSGTVRGRKEVGGIAGQMEPVTRMEFSEDTLQTLQQQIYTMTNMTSQVSADAQAGVSAVDRQFDILSGQMEQAEDALKQLLPKPPVLNPGDLPNSTPPEFPDLDTVLAAKNQLSSSVSGMMSTVDNISNASRSAAETLTGNLSALAQQAGALGKTVYTAGEHLGISVTDQSDSDTESDLTSKVEDCRNKGSIHGDRNVGGIAGAIAIESDLDHEADLRISGYRSLNSESELRSVILGCANEGNITVKIRAAGGITGWQSMGLVKNCRSCGTISGEQAEFLGGITGDGSGFIRNCQARSVLTGKKSLGGIAGCAPIVTDCRSLVRTESSGEKLGGILGSVRDDPRQAPEDAPVSGNIYVAENPGLGGTDGVDYAGISEAATLENFLSDGSLPEEFRTVTITFRQEDGTQTVFRLPTGGSLEPAEIPPVAEKEGSTGCWQDLELADLEGVFFDRTYCASYEIFRPAGESIQTRPEGDPIVLAAGRFAPDGGITITESTDFPELSRKEKPVEAWCVSFGPQDTVVQLRYLPEKGQDPENLVIYTRTGPAAWSRVPVRMSGRYLVFDADETVSGFCVITAPSLRQTLLRAAEFALLAAFVLTVVLIWRYKVRKKSRSAQKC